MATQAEKLIQKLEEMDSSQAADDAMTYAGKTALGVGAIEAGTYGSTRLGQYLEKQRIHQALMASGDFTKHPTKKDHYIHKKGGTFALDTTTRHPNEWGIQRVKED